MEEEIFYPDDIDPEMMDYPMDKFISDVEEALKQRGECSPHSPHQPI